MAHSRKILVTGPGIAPGAVRFAAEAGYELVYSPPYPSAEALVELVREHDPVGVVSRAGRFDEAPMKAARSLLAISKHGAGVDNIDVEAATRHGVQVMRAAGVNAVSVAEHAVALAVAVVKSLRPLDIVLRQGKWEKVGFVGRELAGMKVGLVGAGAIGRVAARLFRGLGMEVMAFDPVADDSVFAEMGAARCVDLDKMLSQVDLVSLHCPLLPDTRNLLNERTIALMPKGSYIVNAARGGLIDEAALSRALESGHIAGAGLDTFATEPVVETPPLFAARDLIVTPHVGASTAEAMDRVAVAALKGIVDFVEGREVPASRLVNRVENQKSAG